MKSAIKNAADQPQRDRLVELVMRIMEQPKKPNPELEAKQKRLLQILGEMRAQDNSAHTPTSQLSADGSSQTTGD